MAIATTMSPGCDAGQLPKADPVTGLDEETARQRLNRFGLNAVEEPVVPLWLQFAEKFWGPVPWMLEAVIVLQVLLCRNAGAVVIEVLLVFNAVTALLQERKAGSALSLLKHRLRGRARVLRNGTWGERPAGRGDGRGHGDGRSHLLRPHHESRRPVGGAEPHAEDHLRDR